MARYFWKRAKAEEVNVHVTAVVPLLQKLRPLCESELRRARRYQRPLSLMIFALDAAVADHESSGSAPVTATRGNGNGHAPHNGHAAGAEALHGAAARTNRTEQCILLGQLLQEVLRETDLPGYEPATQEFVALLPEADSSAADEAGERIRRLWSALPGAFNLTIGMATYPEGGLLLEDLMDSARRAPTSPRVRNPAGGAQGVTHG